MSGAAPYSGLIVLNALCWLSLLSCGGGSGGGGTQNGPASPAAAQFSHVLVILEENHSFQQVIGQSVMPYLNSLVSQFGLATNYFANAHPSLPNYFMLTTGQTLTTSDTGGMVMAETVVNALMAAGKTWKCYAESIPSAGYNGGNTDLYDSSHVPFVFFSDVQNDAAQMANIVPFSQLSADTMSNQLRSYAFIVPNLQDNAHDCPGGGQSCDDSVKLAQADAWLAKNIQPLLNPILQQGGLLLITFDEGGSNDAANGGGQVPLLVISSKSKTGYKSTTFYQHQNTLRLTMDALSVTDLPGQAAGATQMGEFFH